MNIIGRTKEKKLLQRLYDSKQAEFLAVYGRRRIGKTYLISSFFKNKGLFFEVTGVPETSTHDQILRFHREFGALFADSETSPPKDWSEALHRLTLALAKIPSTQKITLFFDELPWLASPRSRFLEALDYFWNRHVSRMPNVLLIVCGSAASWMIRKVIDNRAGLYGRLSAQLRLLPFSLSETEEYLKARSIEISRKQLCELYMVTGGVPKYLNYIERGQSAAQIVHELCFHAQAPLLTEFHKLYHSLFAQAQIHLQFVEALAGHHRGLTKEDLYQAAHVTSGGGASDALRELEEAGFIRKAAAFASKEKLSRYYLADEYSLFYLRWIQPIKAQLLSSNDPNYWLKQQASQSWKSWSGYAFESLCMKHVAQIKQTLGISGVSTTDSQWQYRAPSTKTGAEIDLVIDRADQCINLCEMKFCNDEFVITKDYAESLRRKKQIFHEQTGSRKALFTTLVTPYGVKSSVLSRELVDSEITLEQLF